MVRRATYSRMIDDAGHAQHSVTLSTAGVLFSVAIGFASVCSLAFAVHWAFAEPRVLAVVRAYSEQVIVPRIERIEQDIERRDSALNRRLDDMATDIRYIRQRVDAAADAGNR